MNALAMPMVATLADLRGMSVNQTTDVSRANFFKLFHLATV
ncbi:hypothetical protein [Janthinobacterium sp. B9-8]|nr:hypothetical protein [Janthinobacterium sp. B9-8]